MKMKKVVLTDSNTCRCCGCKKTEGNTPKESVVTKYFWCNECLPKLEVIEQW